MPHIHTAPGQIDYTVTAYIIRLDGTEPRALLHMHKKLHKLLPVGGHIELDETPWSALAHEVEEESGYQLAELSTMQPSFGGLDIAGVISHPYPIFTNTHAISDEHYHTDISYLLTATSSPSLDVAGGESSDLRWLSQSELSAIGSDIIWSNTKKVYDLAFSLLASDWQSVPATNFSLDVPSLAGK